MATGEGSTRGGPSEEELLELSHQITTFWNLGIRLGLSLDTLDNIYDNVQFGSPQQKGLQMLREWSRRREMFSYQTLSQALIKEGYAELAQKYCADHQILQSETASIQKVFSLATRVDEAESPTHFLQAQLAEAGDIRCWKNDAHLLGEGSRGTKVYKGELISSGSSVAVKVMFSGMFDLEEAKRLRSFEHPNIIRCLAVETASNFIYLALELCRKTLRSCVEEGDFQTEDSGLDRLRCLKEITAAVVYLHERNIMHRDIKPDNILLSESKPHRLVLADFNTSKDVRSVSTQFGNAVGTAGYIASEMYRVGERATIKADLFSLGCVFYYILTDGKHPFGSVKRLKECQIKICKLQTPDLVEAEFRGYVWVKLIISNMILHDEAQRPNAPEVMQALERTREMPEEPALTFPARASNSTEHTVMAISLPDTVLSVCRTADKTTAVTKAMEHLQLDGAALMEPSADTRQKVRGLANQLKSWNRADAVRHLRTLVPSGTTGPLLDELLPVRQMPFKQRRDLTVFLSGGEEWKLLADRLGLSNNEIRFLDRRRRNPADGVLAELQQRAPNYTVGDLYDVLVEIDLPVAADIM